MEEKFLDIEQAENLAKILRENDITAFGFDLDDTLIGTAGIFDDCFNAYCARVDECYGLDEAQVKASIE